jgi:hypothetical protein
MSTGTHRALELLVGFGLIGYCAYAIYTGRVRGTVRTYSRDENPWIFWTAILITLGFSTAVLFGLFHGANH